MDLLEEWWMNAFFHGVLASVARFYDSDQGASEDEALDITILRLEERGFKDLPIGLGYPDDTARVRRRVE